MLCINEKRDFRIIQFLFLGEGLQRIKARFVVVPNKGIFTCRARGMGYKAVFIGNECRNLTDGIIFYSDNV